VVVGIKFDGKRIYRDVNEKRVRVDKCSEEPIVDVEFESKLSREVRREMRKRRQCCLV